MALVAYGNSDSSDFEDEENEIVPVATLITKPAAPSIPKEVPNRVEETSSERSPNLFNLLPQPSTKKPAVVEEDDDEFLHKKEKVVEVKPKAKITVPSLNDFKDVERPAPTVKPKVTNGKSGLLSILPQPRNGISTATAKSLIPHVLTKKPDKTLCKKAKINSMPLVNEYSDDSDNDEDVQTDFFSINRPAEALPEEIPLDIDQNLGKVKSKPERPKLESFFKKDPVESHVEEEPMEGFEEYASSEAGSSYSNTAEPEPQSNEPLVLDDEAILKLVGARGKRKREEIHIVDINQQEVLGDSREWLLKGLMDDTTKRVSSSKKRGNEPTSQQKRKHQITYLAHQAKANEAELQNQWANSRMSRRQTQNKYGF